MCMRQRLGHELDIFFLTVSTTHRNCSMQTRRWRGVIDCDHDLDLTPVQRVARMLFKGISLWQPFLPHDAMATQKSGKPFPTELNEVGLRNCKAVPQTHDNLGRHQSASPDFAPVHVPHSGLRAQARGALQLSYRADDATGLAVDEPVHDWASHAASALKIIAEAGAAGACYRTQAPLPTFSAGRSRFEPACESTISTKRNRTS